VRRDIIDTAIAGALIVACFAALVMGLDWAFGPKR
jgi:hypothetical protein